MHPQDEPLPAISDAPPRKRLSRRASRIGAAVAVLLLAGVGGLTWHLTRPAPAPVAASGGFGGPGGPGGSGGSGRGAPSTVGVATAERASIPVTLEALGTVTPLASVKVRPQVSGVLEKVLFKEGQMVRAGELLATIDTRQFELALTQAIGQRQRDEAQLDSAKVTLQRFKTLLDQDSIARQEVDTQTALVKQLEGTVMVDRATEGTARLNLSYTRLTAPISGRVGLRTVDVGNVISSSDANGLVLITQVTPIDVVFAVPQDRVGDFLRTSSTAMQVTVFDKTRTNALGTGAFGSLDNQIDTTTGTVKAKARFVNTGLALFPGQFVNVQLLIKSIDNAIVVPITAVRLGGSGDYVYVLNAAERTVSIRPVMRGQATGEKIVIASGLKAGEQVITEGADRLKEGSRVTLAGDAPRGGGRRQGASAAQGASSAAAPAPVATPSRPDVAGPVEKSAPANSALGAPASPPLMAAVPGTKAVGPSSEQRQRMLEQVKDNPEALERRKKLFEKIDSGDVEALARWQSMQQRMQQGGGQGRERPPQ